MASVTSSSHGREDHATAWRPRRTFWRSRSNQVTQTYWLSAVSRTDGLQGFGAMGCSLCSRRCGRTDARTATKRGSRWRSLRSVHRQGGGGFVGGQEDVVGDVVVRVLAGGRVPQAPPGARRERCFRSAARWNPLQLRNGLQCKSSLSAKLVQVRRPPCGRGRARRRGLRRT